MKIDLEFEGWFQCRLATDPDPYDEPRGVSGYSRAFVGEPDLDRIIYFQHPPFVREMAPAIGVTIRIVRIDGFPLETHPLLGAKLNLAGNPVFEGRNGVVAEDGEEPIVPFRLQIIPKEAPAFERAYPLDPSDLFFQDLRCKRIAADGEAMRQVVAATGIWDLNDVWRERLASLSAAPNPSVAQLQRIRFFNENLDNGAVRFFGFQMFYEVVLESEILGPTDLPKSPWTIEFWLGAWDADVMCGYAKGTLSTMSGGEEIRGYL